MEQILLVMVQQLEQLIEVVAAAVVVMIQDLVVNKLEVLELLF
jgi:hypothetical protein